MMCINLESFCTSKETITRTKRKTYRVGGKSLPAIHQQELISPIHEELKN
jgi:hypothetical protein